MMTSCTYWYLVCLLRLGWLMQSPQGHVAKKAIVFQSSMCYDVYGNANVQLRCPQGYNIKTTTAFTGISRTSACSYQDWDCVIQEGMTHRCDGRPQCTVSVAHTGTIDTKLSCGPSSKTTYFQIEYECLSPDGKSAVVVETATRGGFSKPATVRIHNQASSNQASMATTPLAGDKPLGISLTEDKFTLIAIICGSVVGLILVIAVTATLAHRIKNRTYEHSSLYGPGPMGRGLINPPLNRGSREAAPHRNANRPSSNPPSMHYDAHSTIYCESGE